MDNILERVIKLTAEHLGLSDQITPETKFVDDLGADSLDTVELVMMFEDEFGMEIPDEEAEKFSTINDVANYVRANRKI
jgi:acyl carrier protein